MADIAARLNDLDWTSIERSLWEVGYAKTPPVLTPDECAELIAMYGDEARFRSTVDMARYRFGVGEYKYFAAPLPPLVQALRERAYPPLAAIATQFEVALDTATRHPAPRAALQAVCHKRGQKKPTPLLLNYEAGGYNCLHQDIYGDVVFPLQLTCFLSRRGVDYEGGDFLLVEQRPRAQSRGEAIATEQGEIVIFPTRHRPLQGARGWYRASMRHGVSRLPREGLARGGTDGLHDVGQQQRAAGLQAPGDVGEEPALAGRRQVMDDQRGQHAAQRRGQRRAPLRLGQLEGAHLHPLAMARHG